jgi:hypothetical protein
MHRSRIGVFQIDHTEESYDAVFCVVPVQSGDHVARHARTWR